MKKDSLFSRCLAALLLGCIFTVSTMTACQASIDANNMQAAAQLEEAPTRRSLLTQMQALQVTLAANPNDRTAKLDYATKLFQLGDFNQAKAIVAPIVQADQQAAEAVYLLSQIEYVVGNYAEAETLFRKVNAINPQKYRTKAETGLLFTYYQTNQFDKAKNITADLEKTLNDPLRTMMNSFHGSQPYQLDWNGNAEVVVPFITKEPLPVVSVEVNGKKINAFIDTGADTFFLDETIASSLNIEKISTVNGTYAGGISVETAYGKVASLSLNGVTLTSVPVTLAPISQFSSDQIEIGGIISTGILKQFLATMDYPNAQLILRPRNASGQALLQQYLSDYNETTTMPFALASSHYMTAKGFINGQDSLNFFMDSGLADEKASLILVEQTMDFAGIAMPKTEKDLNSIGGLGGNDFEVGAFTVDAFGLGKLPIEKDMGALYGVLEASFNYEASRGFVMDGLLSHNYFKKYSWTIDFDTMNMFFAK